MEINRELLDNLLAQAAASPRLRQNFDLRNSPEDSSQRMLNALLPGTVLPIHRHTRTTETLVLLRGRMEEIFYEEYSESVRDGAHNIKDVCPGCPDPASASLCTGPVIRESSRVLLEAGGPVHGLSIPIGQWHTVNVLEPTVILECKDGRYEPLSPEDIIEN